MSNASFFDNARSRFRAGFAEVDRKWGWYFALGVFLIVLGLERLLYGSRDDHGLRCGAWLGTTRRGCGIGRSFVSDWQVERFSADFGGRSPQRSHGDRDPEQSAFWCSRDRHDKLE
jgi:hypothetical protein